MSQQFSLRANHRDTFRLIPVGSTDPGDYIHVPTNPSGFAFFTASPANYHVYCRPAYTGEFTLLESTVDGGYQYLRTLNPEIDASGIISLTALVNNLSIVMESAHGNLPYITKDEVLSIRVLSTAGGVPTSELQQAPDLTVYKKPGGTGDPVVHGTATYDQSQYDTAQPHVYHYTYSFNDQDDQDLYYLQAFASYENVLSPGYPDTVYFYLDYIPPILVDQATITSSSSADAGFTPTTTVVGSIPETAMIDDQSGPGAIHLQPYMGSLVQTNDPTPAPGGLKYVGWNASGYHEFTEDHLDDWAMTVSSGYMLVITDDNGKDFLYNNHGAAYPSVNQYTLHNIGSAGTTKEVHIPDKDVNGGPVDGGSDVATFTATNYYQYKLFPAPIRAYCKNDPAITSKATCESTGTCSDGSSTTPEDCATNSGTWTYYTWLTDQTAIADWPITFAYGGNLTQSLSLTQNVDPGFIDDLEGIEYGYLMSATDNAKNTNTSWAEFLKPSIVYDTVVELAPNLSWSWIKNYKVTDEGAFTNGNGWFNTGADFLNDGWCDDDSGDNQKDCCTNNSGSWSNNACTGASTTWHADRLTLLVTCTNDQSQQDTLFGVQASFDGITWTEFSGSGNAYLINGQTSQFWINAVPGSELVKQGSHNLYLRSVNTDGGATGNTYSIEYKWDKLKPVWTTTGALTATGGFNRANITWTDGPMDDGAPTTPNEVGSGGELDSDEGYSGTNQIKLYRSKKTGATPDDWDTVIASPSTYELVLIGTFSSSLKEYTDTSFYNVQYDAEVIDPYYYWGIPIDIAGNEGQDIRHGNPDAILLTSSNGVEVTPLEPADVAGALGTSIYIDATTPDPTSVITKRDIAVPTEGLVLRTNNVSTIRAVKELSYSADGFTYTSIPIIERLGEDYPTLYADLSDNGTTLQGGLNITIQDTLDNLGITHLDGVSGTGGHLGLSYIRTGRCDLGSSYLAGPTEVSCATNDGTWEETLQAVLIDSVSEASSITTIALDSLDSTYASNLVTLLNDSTWKVDIGLFLLDNTVYAFNIPVVDNQYYFKTTFDTNVPSAPYCLGWPAYTDQATCEAAGKTWILNNDIPLTTEGLNWSTKLAADLIVGGTLRLETGLSIWSGGYVNGEPQGTGLTMDELGLRMFNSSNTTVEMDASDGSFAMGDLSNESGSKLLYNPTQGQLTLIGNLYQVQPDLGSYSPEFVGDWIEGTCSSPPGSCTGSEISEAACDLCSGTWTLEQYNSGDVVLYNGQYWLCIGTNVTSVPSIEENVDWTLYASGSIEGKQAKYLFINAASQYFVSDEDNNIESPATIKVGVNTQGVSNNVTWSISAKDLSGTAIDCSGSNGINLYTDDTNGIESSLNISPTTDVYLYASNFQSAQASSVELTCSYNEIAADGQVLTSLEDSITVVRLMEGSSTYNIILSNESHTVMADEFGNVDAGEWTSATTSVQLFRGTEARDCTITSTPSGSGWVSQPTQATLPNYPSVYLKNETNGASDPLTGTTSIAVTDTISGDTVGTSTFTVTKVLAGISEKTVSLLPTTNTFTYDPNGQVIVTPSTEYIDVTVALQGGVVASTLEWTLQAGDNSYSISEYNAGGAYSDLDDLEIQQNSVDPADPHVIRIKLNGTTDLYTVPELILSLALSDQASDPNNTLTYNDEITITRLNTGTDAIVGNLSNDNFSVSAEYTGEAGDLSNAGGIFSLYQGSNLLSSDIEFFTLGSWYGRMWKEETTDSIIPNQDALSFETLLALDAPDQFKIRKWTDLNNESRFDMDHSGESTFFDTDPGDDFVVWGTTFIKVSELIEIPDVQMGGDNEYKVYIDGILYAHGNNTTLTHAIVALSDNTGLPSPSAWGEDPTQHAEDYLATPGPWHRIDVMYHENSGGDYVKCGFNPGDFLYTMTGGSSIVCDINYVTGQYDLLYVDPKVYIPGGKQWLHGRAAVDDGNGGTDHFIVEKEFTVTKAFSGDPGTYYKSVYLTTGIHTVAALEAAITGEAGDLFDTHDWPPAEENDDLDGLDGWINSPPPDAIPGLTTWETRKLYRTDGTEIEGEGWSTPFVAGSVPLDPVIYYLKPTSGTSLLNGEGTLNVVATQQDQTNGESEIDISTNIRMATADDGGSLLASNNETFSTSDIDGTLTLYLINTSNNNAVLDTLTLVDVTDGQPVGVVTGNPGLVFTQTGPNSWNPGTITVDAQFYDVNGNIEAATQGILDVNFDNGYIDIQSNFNSSIGNIGVAGNCDGTTTQCGLTFTLTSDPSRFVQETFYSVTQGETGETGLTGPAGPSVTYTGGWQVDRGLYYAGTYSGDHPDGGGQGDAIGEVVRFDHTSPLSPKEWHEDNGAYYICTTEHDPLNILPADGTGAVNVNYWQQFGAQFESVATGLLLAETVIAQDMFGETLELTDSFTISSPSGTCTNIAMNLEDADGNGGLQTSDNTDADDATYNGHWAMGTNREILHNDWDAAGSSTFSLPATTVIALNSYDAAGTSYKEELLSLQPGAIIELYTDNNIDQSGDPGLAEDFYDVPFYFKIVEDTTKLAAGQPTGVYMSQTLLDAGPTTNYGSNVVSEHVMQLDVEYLPTLPDGTDGNTLADSWPWDNGVGIKLRLHTGFSTEGECLASGGTWTPHNQRVALTATGLQAYNGGGDQTVNIKSKDGSFTFGNFDAGQGINYTSGGLLEMKGTMIIDGTSINDQMRTVNLTTEQPSFIFETCYLNFNGSILSEAPWPSIGEAYAQGAMSWNFQTTNDGPLLIRVSLNDPDGKIELQLNGSSLGGPYVPYYDDYSEGADNDGVWRWYEWFDDGTHAITGANNVSVVCADGTDCIDGFTIKKLHVFGNPNTESITIIPETINMGAEPSPVWTATQTSPLPNSNFDPNITLQAAGDSQAVITLREFMHHTADSPLRSTGVAIQAYYAGGSQDPVWTQDISDTITINRLLPGLPGEQSITGYLTNETQSIGMDHTGPWSDPGGNTPTIAVGEFKLYDGLNLVSYDDIDFSAEQGANTVCGIVADGTYAISEVTAGDVGICTLTAAYGGVTLDKIFTLSLAREGETIVGDPAKGVILTADTLQYINHEDGSTTPSQINFTAQCINCENTGTWGGTLSGVLNHTDGSVLTNYIANTDFSDGGTVTYTAHVDDGESVDTVTLTALDAGSSAITVVLSNEAHVLPADVNGEVLDYSGSGSELRVYQGSTELTYDGSGTAAGKWFISNTADSGDITFDATTDGGTYANLGAVTATTSTVDTFTATYTIAGKTLANESFTGFVKTRSISKSKTGAAGESGAPSMSHTFIYDDLDNESGQANGNGRYKIWTGGGDVFSEAGGMQSGFQNANMLLINKNDMSGTDRSYIFENITAGQELVFFVNNNRWYQYIVLEDVEINPDGLSNRFGFHLQYKAHIVDIDSTITTQDSDGTGTIVSFGFSALQGVDGTSGERGSRTFYSEWCGQGGSWSDAEAEATANEDGGPVLRDVVTLFCDTEEWSTTKFFNGTGDGTNAADWTEVTQVIDGNLLVSGTITADALAADVIDASFISAGSIQADQLQIGTTGNLLGLEIADATSWAQLEALGWSYSNFSGVSLADITANDTEGPWLQSTRQSVKAQNNGEFDGIIYSPWVPVDPSSTYTISTMINMDTPNNNSTYQGSYYFGLHFSNNGSSNNVECTKKYKSTNSTLPFEDNSWGTSSSTNQYLFWSADFEPGTYVGDDGQAAGLATHLCADRSCNSQGSCQDSSENGCNSTWSGQRYKHYWTPINRMAHHAGTDDYAARTGGNLKRTYEWARAHYNDDASGQASPNGSVSNVVVPAGATHMRLRWLLYKSGSYGTSGNQNLNIASASISRGQGTEIDGASITTGSITADKISVNILTTNDLTAENIVATGSITSVNDQTFWNLENEVFIVKDESGNVRVKIGDLTAANTPDGN